MVFSGRRICAFFVLALVLGTTGCGTSVKRMEAEDVKDLSGAWNDTDSRLVSEEMIKDALARTWLRDYVRKHREQPAVIVGDMRNLSHEHINMHTFVADIERAMINSGKVRFVASSTERRSVREERRDQGTTQVRYYQVDMTLIDLADNEKVWIGQKKIKKLVKRSQLRF
jgi:PBP1b-binding outer membrane lipoprotein LpoB